MKEENLELQSLNEEAYKTEIKVETNEPRMPRVFVPRGNKRNMVRQEIKQQDGSVKVVYHQKKFNAMQYGNFHAIWNENNTTAKVNSKRQRLLRGEEVK